MAASSAVLDFLNLMCDFSFRSQMETASCGKNICETFLNTAATLVQVKEALVPLFHFQFQAFFSLLHLISCSSFKCRYRNIREWLIWENTLRQLHEEKYFDCLLSRLINFTHALRCERLPMLSKLISNWVKILKEINLNQSINLISVIRSH